MINLEIHNIELGATYEILSLAGERLSSGIVSNRISTIDIQSLSSGVYIMNIVISHFTKRLKFVVI